MKLINEIYEEDKIVKDLKNTDQTIKSWGNIEPRGLKQHFAWVKGIGNFLWSGTQQFIGKMFL